MGHRCGGEYCIPIAINSTMTIITISIDCICSMFISNIKHNYTIVLSSRLVLRSGPAFSGVRPHAGSGVADSGLTAWPERGCGHAVGRTRGRSAGARVFVRVCVYVCMCVCVCVYIYIYTYVYIYLYVYMYICICIYIYIYIYIYIVGVSLFLSLSLYIIYIYI